MRAQRRTVSSAGHTKASGPRTRTILLTTARGMSCASPARKAAAVCVIPKGKASCSQSCPTSFIRRVKARRGASTAAAIALQACSMSSATWPRRACSASSWATAKRMRSLESPFRTQMNQRS